MNDNNLMTNSSMGLGERLLYMLLFIICYNIAEIVLVAVVVIQLLHQLVLREPNQNLLNFSAELSRYIYLVLQFLCFNSDEKPFPMSDWPRA